MSINVTVNGNRLNIRRGRMILSDLDQIKKNERDRRRRLRLEQVRQQSKEISDRLLERTKNIAKEEFKKLENDKLNAKLIYNGKIIEVQQKYQEDMADIGQAHISAALEPDHDALIEERDKRNKLTAIKRGQEAMKQIKDIQQKETLQQQHQERLHQIREVENLRSSMVANLSKKPVPEEDTVCVSIQKDTDEDSKEQKSAKKKMNKHFSKKSAGKITKTYIKLAGSDFKTHTPVLKSKLRTLEANPEHEISILEQQSTPNSVTEPLFNQTASREKLKINDKNSKKEVTNTAIKVDKSVRYNPQDYVQTTSESINSDSSASFSDDSSYFSDSGEQCINKEIKTAKRVKCPITDKVQLYDHSKHQSNVYDQPVGVVEKIHKWNEPSAIDLAQKIEQTQIAESHLLENRKYNAQKRGEDATLREKVRRDYQILMQNLDQLASKERKLKASQVKCYPRDVYMLEQRRKLLRDQHKKKLNRALKPLLTEKSSEHFTSCPVERQITLPPIKENKSADTHIAWEEPCCFNQFTDVSKISQNKYKETETSHEEQILDMLKKVERQKRLLLQEFGADLPNDIFSASTKPLFERDKSIQTQTTDSQDINIQKSLSPDIKVINASCNEKEKKTEVEKKDDPSIKKVEIAVQTITGDKSNIVQDKSTQVELVEEKKNESTFGDDEVKKVTKYYPIEPQITVIRPEVESSSSSSTSSETINIISNLDKQNAKVISPKKMCSKKTLKQSPSKTFHKSRSTSKTSSPIKKFSKSMSKSQYNSPKKSLSTEDVPNKKIKMYIDKDGFNIKVKPPQVAEVFVDVSTQSAQVYSAGTQHQSTSKQQWIQSKSKRIKIKDISDTSTSFVSPPPIKPKDLLEALNNNMSILELLDSSANENIKVLKKDISPVSTPETPSPRTMRMPSNIPHPSKIKKLLQYSSTDSQTNNNTLSSIKNDYSTSADSSEYNQNECLSKIPVSLGFCLCNNTECEQVHAKFNEIRNYALKNCPQILQKYENLQTTCAERIISLTHLIEKVRNEQKGMEFSMIDPNDETSLMQLPPPRVMTNDLQDIHKLVENIEAIHNQLAKTLIESQEIIKDKTVIKEEINQIKETERVVSVNDDTSKNVVFFIEPKTGIEQNVEKAKVKPKIINEERVNIQLNKFKMHKSSQVLTATPERDTWLLPKHHEEEVIEKLSKEILEQSKGLDNNSVTSKEIYNSAIKHSIQTSTDNDDYRNYTSKTQRNDTVIRKYPNKESKKTKDFIPLLNDIPKTSKAIDNSMHTNGRSKPPVSLLSGPYRAEIESSGHELSTIIEFDTPDTVNRSQNNIKSPLTMKKVTETQVTKSTALIKSSEYVAPSFNLHIERLKTLGNSSIISTKEIKESSTFLDSPKISRSVESQNLIENKEKKKEDIVQQTRDKKLQCDAVDQGSLQIEELQHFSSTTTDVNKEYNSNKDKITSTSSNTFSELSGVSQIVSTPSSTLLKYTSSPEEMEIALKKLGLGWAITTLKKTREASALSSSSNSDVTPINTAKRIISPVKKQFDHNYGLLDFSDVSSISIKDASKSTEQAVLLKGRTSTPKLQNSNSNSGETNTTNTNNSENFQEPDNDLVIPNISLTKTKSNNKRLESL